MSLPLLDWPEAREFCITISPGYLKHLAAFLNAQRFWKYLLDYSARANAFSYAAEMANN